MRLVVADTGPINYLVLIDAIGVLPMLFERIFIPAAVQAELTNAEAPEEVRTWIGQPPAWFEVRPNPEPINSSIEERNLDEGERAAIALARAISADLILMDDRAGVAVAQQHGLTVTGTLGVLELAARRGLVDLASVLTRLKATNFRYPPEIMDALLARWMANKR
jgi:predicted nucleic acid-binding protein